MANDNPYYAYFIWGNNVLQWTQTYGDTIGENKGLIGVIKRGNSTTDMAYAQNFFTDSILINRDKVMDNLVTELKLANAAISSAKLQDSCVVAGKIQAGAVTSEKIYAGAVTAVKIDAGAIDATKLAAEIILATIIWAGVNKVKLDSTGIQVFGEYLFIKDTSGNLRGSIYGGANAFVFSSSGCQLWLLAAAGYNVLIQPGTGGAIVLAGALSAGGLHVNTLHTINPYSVGVSDIGGSTNKWRNIYGTPILSTSYYAPLVEGMFLMVGGTSAGLYIYSSGAWRLNE